MLNKTQEGPNHRMPVRALRPKITSEATLLRIRPNHRMPVRALRPKITSEATLLRIRPNHRMPVRALRRTSSIAAC